MNYLKITQAYYSAWLGKEGIVSDADSIEAFFSEERNKTQEGYADPYDLLVWKQSEHLIISYGDKAKSKVDQLIHSISIDINSSDLMKVIQKVYQTETTHFIAFVFQALPDISSRAVLLNTSHYQDFLQFFKSCQPDANPDGWLQDYYEGLVLKRQCWAIMNDGLIVSCTEAPGMPYMKGQVEELGINTLPNYQRQGFAREACAAAIQEKLRQGVCPMWSTTSDNISSQTLAEKSGFIKLADYFTITL